MVQTIPYNCYYPIILYHILPNIYHIHLYVSQCGRDYPLEVERKGVGGRLGRNRGQVIGWSG